MKRRLSVLHLLTGLGSLFVCALHVGAEGQQAAPLRLGMISPLSGDFGAYGAHIRDGIEVAQDRLRQQGIDARVSFEDACLAVQARGAVNKLISSEQIEGLVASYCVVGMVPAAPILDAAHVVSFHTSVVPQSLLDAGSYIFTTNTRIRDEATRLAEHAFQKLGARKAGLLYLTTQWGEEYKKYFAQRFTQMGGSVVGEETNPIGVNDFRTELTRLRNSKPDVILAVHVGPTLGTAIKQARSIGMTQQFLTVNEAEEQGVIDVAGEAAENLLFYAPEPASETAEMKRFDDEFKTKFGRAPHSLSRHSFDATMLVATALTKCKRDPECTRDALHQTSGYSGASGVFSIEGDGGTKREYVLKTVRASRFTRLN